MNIAKIDNNSQRASFKSTYPVVHLIQDTKGGWVYASGQLKKEINTLFVRALNKTLPKNKEHMVPYAQNIRAYIEEIDPTGYSSDNPLVRTFKDKSRRFVDRLPNIYILSGEDGNVFGKLFGKKIGTTKHEAKEATGNVYNDNSISAIQTYYREGLDFVNTDCRRLKDGDGNNVTLYTYSKIIRDMFGEAKECILQTVQFFPNKVK